MEVRGSNPRVRIDLMIHNDLVTQIDLVIPFGGVAQLGEHLLCKQRVMGSSPFTSTSRSQCIVLAALKSAGRKSSKKDLRPRKKSGSFSNP